MTWARQEDGSWIRQILAGGALGGVPHPIGQLQAWGPQSPEAPPDELVEQTVSAARTIISALRLYRQRQAAARKIQALWRGSQERQLVSACHALLSLIGA